jgi:uridylate kinase
MRLVVKIGGSMSIDEHGPKADYFKKLIPVLKEIQKNHQLIVSIGGGKFIRDYYSAVKSLGLSDEEMEWIAVDLLRVNVRFLSQLLKTKPLLALKDISSTTSGVIGGISPGRSTDANAAYAAAAIKADYFIKLTDVDGIYTADPDVDKNATKIDRIPFKEITKYTKTGKPGSYGILDKNAAETIKKKKIKTIVMSGKEPEDLLKVIKGQKIGTIISD